VGLVPLITIPTAVTCWRRIPQICGCEAPIAGGVSSALQRASHNTYLCLEETREEGENRDQTSFELHAQQEAIDGKPSFIQQVQGHDEAESTEKRLHLPEPGLRLDLPELLNSAHRQFTFHLLRERNTVDPKLQP